MGWQDAPLVEQSAPKWASAPVVEEEKKFSLGEYLKNELRPESIKRGAGLALRTVGQAATDIPALLLDIPVRARNALSDDPPLSLPSALRDADLTGFGLPEPENAGERIISAAGRGALSAGGTATALSKVPGAVTQALSARPLLQTVSGASGGASGQTAAELGAGPFGQLAATLGGAIAPALLAPRAPTVPYRLEPENQSIATAKAAAGLSPGEAAAAAGIQATPEVKVSGGGYTFGNVGPDDSAGLNSTLQRVAERGKAIGMRLTPGQATGSRSLQQLEAKLESQPFSSGPFNRLKAGNATAVNRASASAIGESANVVDDVVLSRAADRIGQVFENVADDVARPVEPRQFIGFLSELQGETRGLLSGGAKITAHPLVDDLINFAQQGAATGKQLQALNSRLGKAAVKQMLSNTGDRELGIALYRVKDYVDDLLAQGLSKERAAEFTKARQEYRNLMLLTQRIGVVNQSGNVSGRNLANVLAQKDKRGFLYGENQSPMYDAARFSQGFAPIVGDSGTATRSPLPGPWEAAAKIPLNLATKAYLSGPSVKLAVGAQATIKSTKALARALAQPVGPEDFPAAGAAGAANAQSTEAKRRRAIAEALLRP